MTDLLRKRLLFQQVGLIFALLSIPSFLLAKPDLLHPSKKHNKKSFSFASVKRTSFLNHLFPIASHRSMRSFQTLLAQNTDKNASDDNFVPEIVPIAPLPSTYREIKIQTSPSHLLISVWKKNEQLSCLPENRTPCKIKVFGYNAIPLTIIVYRGKEQITYQRQLKGRNLKTENWLLTLPPPPSKARRNPKKKVPHSQRKSSTHSYHWLWIGLSSVIVVGTITSIVLYAKSLDDIGFKCVDCPQK